MHGDSDALISLLQLWGHLVSQCSEGGEIMTSPDTTLQVAMSVAMLVKHIKWTNDMKLRSIVLGSHIIRSQTQVNILQH